MLGSTLKSYLFAQSTHPIEVALNFSSPAHINYGTFIVHARCAHRGVASSLDLGLLSL